MKAAEHEPIEAVLVTVLAKWFDGITVKASNVNRYGHESIKIQLQRPNGSWTKPLLVFRADLLFCKDHAATIQHLIMELGRRLHCK